jgi:hypothetical protein
VSPRYGNRRQWASFRAALLKQENWTDDELDALRAEIERVREDRRRS